MSSENPFFQKLEEKIRNIHGILDEKVKILDWEEVQKHNKVDDCWIVIDKKIYDVSLYLSYHPGSSEKLLNHAGNDVSIDFEYWRHSQNARKIKDKFCIGIVSDKKQ